MTKGELHACPAGTRFAYTGPSNVGGRLTLVGISSSGRGMFLDDDDREAGIGMPWYFDASSVKPIIRIRANTNEVIDV